MLFVDPVFFVFFAVVFLLYWQLPSNRLRKILLLVASYFFYGFWDWRFLGLIALSSTIDYVAGLRIDGLQDEARRKWWLAASITANLGILAVFKYLNFFRESLAGLLTAFGQPTNFASLDIVLPVGISFFTFQSMSYTIDIYRRRIRSEADPLDFFLYVAFFPQLVAGPIVRAKTFLPQLQRKRCFPTRRLPILGMMFAVGFFKKVAVSDNIAGLIDPIFASPQGYEPFSLAMAGFLYAVQIYCDFSGYTDMAIAVGGFLGYHLPRNFAAPYLARSFADFWRRWHISLSTWLRDYLYISLGGNRRGRAKTYRNLMITMGLGGLWHGASWNFVIWGLLHGCALAVERFFRERGQTRAGAKSERIGLSKAAWMILPGVKVAGVFAFVCLCWIFFRAVKLDTAVFMISSIFTGSSPGTGSLPAWTLPASVMLAMTHFVFHRWSLVRRVILMPRFAVVLPIGAIMSAALLLLPQDTVPFIYFQF